MWIEATKPLLVQFQSGAVSLRPGKPIELPDEAARKLLVQAAGKVREVPPVQVDDLVGRVVGWRGERALVRLTLLDQGVRWLWVESPCREGWTRVYTPVLPCPGCRASTWWWRRDEEAFAIRCVQCHPPVPDWASERREIAELTHGLNDSTVATLALACDAAATSQDYSVFLAHKERLRVYVGGLVRGSKR